MTKKDWRTYETMLDVLQRLGCHPVADRLREHPDGPTAGALAIIEEAVTRDDDGTARIWVPHYFSAANDARAKDYLNPSGEFESPERNHAFEQGRIHTNADAAQKLWVRIAQLSKGYMIPKGAEGVQPTMLETKRLLLRANIVAWAEAAEEESQDFMDWVLNALASMRFKEEREVCTKVLRSVVASTDIPLGRILGTRSKIAGDPRQMNNRDDLDIILIQAWARHPDSRWHHDNVMRIEEVLYFAPHNIHGAIIALAKQAQHHSMGVWALEQALKPDHRMKRTVEVLFEGIDRVVVILKTPPAAQSIGWREATLVCFKATCDDIVQPWTTTHPDIKLRFEYRTPVGLSSDADFNEHACFNGY